MEAQSNYTDIEKKSEAATRGALRAFLKEYWLWITIPFVVVLAVVLLLLFFMHGDDGASPFQYSVF